VHIDGDVLGHDLLGEGNESLGNAAKHNSWVGAGVDVRKLEDEIRRRRDPAAHGHAEKVLLGLHVPQNGSRGHA
jgi:hypothetical protein